MPAATAALLALALAGQVETASAAVPLVDVARLHSAFVLDIRYATRDNFFGRQVYPEARCLLRREVAAKLMRARAWLETNHPGLRFLLKDCYRPASIQHVLWDAVKGTPRAAYVANPRSPTGSIHSYGAAVDLTLADASGRELDMGTPYDFLGRLAEPRLEATFLREGKLSRAQVQNRGILRAAMKAGGFRSIPNEWWHFDDATKAEVRRRYPRLDLPFSAVP